MVHKNKLAILYTTINTPQEAEKLARLVLSHKMAVCVNIMPYGKSVYFWQGNMETNEECYMLFKTVPELRSQLEQCILEHHPYDTPAILKWDVETSPGFLEYVHNGLF